jgi:hypothetical protein
VEIRDDVRYLRFLAEAGELLAASLDVDETLDAVCKAAVTTVADICIVDLGEPGETQLAAAAHRDAALTPEVVKAGRYLESGDGRPPHPVLRVIENGKPLVAEHIDDRWIDAHATSEDHARYMCEMQYSSMIVVPITSAVYGVTGALTLVTVEEGRAPLRGVDALLFARDLGRRFGMAIGKARIHENALHVAQRFQAAALPGALPDVKGIRFDTLYEPASSLLMVGGDWFDVFMLLDGRIGISVGDVCGHGLDAAVLMATMKNALHSALLVNPDPATALETADYILREDDSEMYCTAMLAILDPDRMTLTVQPAGHPGPRIWIPSRGEVIDPFVERGLPLGWRDLSSENAAPATILLENGTVVVFYTDGLVEGERDLLDGERRLDAAIAQTTIRDAEDPAVAIRNAVAPAHAEDDIAMVVVRTGRLA